jgi:hypothetical protein
MRITLERTDLLKLLSRALGYELLDNEVVIQAEPFEVHLKTVRLLDVPPPEKTPVSEVQVPTAKPILANNTPVDTPINDRLDDLLRQSVALSLQLPSSVIDPDVRGLNDFSRPLGANESEFPPGTDYIREIK